jgi:hypothetical protein
MTWFKKSKSAGLDDFDGHRPCKRGVKLSSLRNPTAAARDRPWPNANLAKEAAKTGLLLSQSLGIPPLLRHRIVPETLKNYPCFVEK